MSHPYIPAANVARVELVYDASGSIMENVYHVLGTAAWTHETLVNLAVAAVSWEGDVGSHGRSTNVQCEKCIVTDLTTETSERIVQTDGLPIPGIIASPILPLNATFAVTSLTAMRGRSYRGRTYWIGLPASKVTESKIDPAFANGLVTGMGALQDAVSTVNGGKLVVLSQFQDGAWLTEAVATEITSYAYADLFTDSQRRRLPGRGM